MALAVILGLGSGLMWGIGDFFGGLQSRALPALIVTFWSQVVGAVGLAIILAITGETPVIESIVWGCVAGLFGGIALVMFYRGLAEGMMSLVAPVSACGAAIPVLYGLLRGELPGMLASAGIIAALIGIVLVSLQPASADQQGGSARRSLIFALGAALGFGLFYVFLARAADIPHASPLWAIAGARMTALCVTIVLLIVARRGFPWPGRRMPLVAAVGILDTTANVLYIFASMYGALGIVGVLGSMYPVATVLLSRFVLAERLSWPQHAGVALALMGVLLLSAG